MVRSLAVFARAMAVLPVMTHLRKLLKKIGRYERVFLVLLALALVLTIVAPASSLVDVLLLAVVFSGVLVLIRWTVAGMRKVIWSLRNRLLVTYLFIAVVPIILILVLAWMGLYFFTGQIAAYLVTTELERRTQMLFDPAERTIGVPPAQMVERARWLAGFLARRFPGFEMAVRTGTEWRYPEDASLNSPPPGWGNTSGLVLKNGAPHLWAHAIHDGSEVTMLVPMDRGALSELVPQLGDVAFWRTPDLENDGRTSAARPRKRIVLTSEDVAASIDARVPPAANRLDRAVIYGAPVRVSIWESPGESEIGGLLIHTRYSKILGIVFGQQVDWGRGVTMRFFASAIFFGAALVFLIVELVSLIIGIRLTRSITGAVHNLYEATQRVRAGDFSHRIEVNSRDQLGELSDSFNDMTGDLDRLLRVAKEKERLQSELEIASEVQNQLYPKAMPVSRNLRFTAICKPARMVSGDYYDFLMLEESRLALAIGDVAGKGISAALLMATVQASMRAQLRAGREMVASADGDSSWQSLSTSTLITRLNQQLYAYTSAEKFSTFYFGIYDDVTGLLTYTNAGHLPPMLFRNGSVTRLDVTGTVVGAFPFSIYEESRIQLQSGDLLVCYTDGVTEPENEYGEMFGEDRLIETVRRNGDHEAEEIMAAVVKSVGEWTGSPELQDDMTMLLARRV